LRDVERLYNDYDTRVFKIVLTEIHKQNELERLQRKLDMAEVINAAYIGSQYDKQGKNKKQFAIWQNKVIREINRLQNRKTLTIWDTFKKSKRIK
jgi:hypothetical protein